MRGSEKCSFERVRGRRERAARWGIYVPPRRARAWSHGLGSRLNRLCAVSVACRPSAPLRSNVQVLARLSLDNSPSRCGLPVRPLVDAALINTPWQYRHAAHRASRGRPPKGATATLATPHASGRFRVSRQPAATLAPRWPRPALLGTTRRELRYSACLLVKVVRQPLAGERDLDVVGAVLLHLLDVAREVDGRHAAGHGERQCTCQR